MRLKLMVATFMLLLFSISGNAQQFNSDNYWTAPHGVATILATTGQNYSTLMNVAALFPAWEFNIGATLYREDKVANTTNHYSATFYVKHMFYENKAKTGGWAVMAGTGVYPGYLQSGTITTSFRSYWLNVPVTLPFFNNTLSWDILPGILFNLDYSSSKKKASGFTYSSRLAVYKIIPQSAIVGEVFGTEGDAYSSPQYKIGIRWESPIIVAALTYGAGFDGSKGGGIEFGIMIFTPPFLKIGGGK